MGSVKKRNWVLAKHLSAIITIIVLCGTLTSHFTRESARADNQDEKITAISGQLLSNTQNIIELKEVILELKNQINNLKQEQEDYKKCKVFQR